MTGRRIAIVGTAPGHDDAPVGDDGWEIWACYWRLASIDEDLCLSRVTRVYELHDSLTREPEAHDALQHKQRARVKAEMFGNPSRCGLFAFYDHPGWGALPLPVDAMIGRFGRYFTNSVSWMIGHALYEHERDMRVDEIGLFGVDMATTKEYAHERPSVEYLCGFARGLGVAVTIPERSDLLHCSNRYGLDEPTWFEHRLYAQLDDLRQARSEIDASRSPYTWTSLTGQIGVIERQLRVSFHTREPEVDR